MEKEAQKESFYRSQVQSLLKKHGPSIHHRPSTSSASDPSALLDQYRSEQRLIDRIVSNERTAFAYGLALSGVVFASVRFGPRYLAKKIGGREKERAMKEAEEAAKEAGTAWMQKGIGALILLYKFIGCLSIGSLLMIGIIV